MREILQKGLTENKILFSTMNQLDKMSPQVKSDVSIYLATRKVACPLCGKKKYKSSIGAVAHVESGSCPRCRGTDIARDTIYNFLFTQEATRYMIADRPQLQYNAGIGASHGAASEKTYICRQGLLKNIQSGFSNNFLSQE